MKKLSSINAQLRRIREYWKAPRKIVASGTLALKNVLHTWPTRRRRLTVTSTPTTKSPSPLSRRYHWLMETN